MDDRSGAWARRVRLGVPNQDRRGPGPLRAACAAILLLLTMAMTCPLVSAETALAAGEEQVRETQRLLKQLALLDPGRYGTLDPGEIDGTIGPSTRQAIRQFRAMEGLPEGGLDDSLHRALLAARVGLALEDRPARGNDQHLDAEGSALTGIHHAELEPPRSTDLAAAIFLSGPIGADSAAVREDASSPLISMSPATEPLHDSNLAVSLSVALATTLSLVLFFVGQRRKARLLAGWRGGRMPRASRLQRPTARQAEAERSLMQTFATLPLQHARDVRDTLIDELTRAADNRSGSLAMLVSSTMKRLMQEDRESYKKIFSNLLFLDRVGRDARAGRISLDRLDPDLNREIDLARGPFRLHLLELAEHDRLRERLPGLWMLLGESDPDGFRQS